MATELKPVLAEIRLSVDQDTDHHIDAALDSYRSTDIDLQEPHDSDWATKSSGKTTARYSVSTYHRSKRRRLMSTSLTPFDSDDSKMAPQVGLHQAARDDSMDIVDEWIQYLSSKEDEVLINKMNEKDEHGLAPIHYAAKFNRFKIVAKLHENGADAMLATNEEQYTALHYAAFYMPPYQVALYAVDGGQSENQEVEGDLDNGRRMMKYILGIAEVDVNVGDKYKVSSLHLACRRGNIVAAQDLLSHPDIIPVIKDEHDDTPLHEACLHGWKSIVEKLLHCNAVAISFYDSFNTDCQTPLHLACQEGHTSIVKMLVEKCPVERVKDFLEARDSRGNTAFHLAVEHVGLANKEEVEIVKTLLDQGANPNTKKITRHVSKQGNVTEFGDKIRPLHLAARYGAVNIVNLLLTDARVVIDVFNANHQTPLHFAAMYDQPEIAIALIDRGAKTGVKDINSCTPFLLAAANGHRKVVQKLIDKDAAQMDSLDKNKKSALYLAAEGAHLPLLVDLIKTPDCASKKFCGTPDSNMNTPLHIAAKLGHLNIVEELLKDDLIKEEHVKTNAKNSARKTPAHLAAENGHVKILKRLLEKSSAFVIDEDENGNSPLHLATLNGWKHAAQMLIERRANIESRNVTLATPLSLAAGSGHVKVVKLLLYFKAEVDVRDRSQATPLHHAVSNGRIDVVKVLIDSGAKCCMKNKDGYNALDLAIECGHEDVARLIIQSNQWEQALQNTMVPLAHNDAEKSCCTTPFRRLIMKMPDVAKDVLNRCITYHEGKDGERETRYNYRYLEDFHKPSCKRSLFTDKAPLKWAKTAYLKGITYHFHADSEMHVDYSNSWGPQGFNKTNHPLAIMTESSDNRLISHPLVISLLMFKLRKYTSFFYMTQLIVHVLLLIFLTIFALLVFNPNSDICKVIFNGGFGSLKSSDKNSSGENSFEICDDDEMFKNNTIRTLCGSCGFDVNYFKVISWAAALSLVALIVRILYFMGINSIRKPITFIKRLQNWIEVPMFICSIIFVSVFGTECLCPASWQWQVGTAAILLAWIDLINLIRKLQVFDIGIYILMFENIIHTFLHTILLSSLLLVAFSLAFYMAFFHFGMNFTPLANPARSLLTVLTYITGGADYNGLFSLSHDSVSEEDHRQLPFLPASILLWITFLIIMIILLINMLIGLAVDDIQGIKKAAEVQRLKLLVDLALTVDSALPYRHLFIVPERTVKCKDFTLWQACNTFFWKGKIVQDTHETVAEALKNQSEPSIEQVHIHTQSLVKEMASIKETIKSLNDRNRRLEATMMHLSTVLGNKFNLDQS